MIVLSLDSDALAVLFLKPVTLAVKGEHVGMGKCLVMEIWAAALALGSFANGVQVFSFHSVPLQAGRADGWALWMGSTLLHSLSRRLGEGLLYYHARFLLKLDFWAIIKIFL